MAAGGVDVRVENQLVRFVPKSPVSHDAVISQLAGQKNGNIVVNALETPRAPIVIDEEDWGLTTQDFKQNWGL